jgi:hypothetical protein
LKLVKWDPYIFETKNRLFLLLKPNSGNSGNITHPNAEPNKMSTIAKAEEKGHEESQVVPAVHHPIEIAARRILYLR